MSRRRSIDIRYNIQLPQPPSVTLCINFGPFFVFLERMKFEYWNQVYTLYAMTSISVTMTNHPKTGVTELRYFF